MEYPKTEGENELGALSEQERKEVQALERRWIVVKNDEFENFETKSLTREEARALGVGDEEWNKAQKVVN